MEKYFTIKVNEKEYDLRLNAKDMVKIESTYKTPILKFIQSSSISNIITLLRYMRKAQTSSFSEDDAYEFFDELTSNGYKLETIIMDVILPTCEVSGLFTKEDLDKIKVMKEDAQVEATTPNTNI